MGRYRESEISILDGLEAVRRRPEMYIGSLSDPNTPNFLLKEALCCARDDALAGRCTTATIIFHLDGSATVRDDGPGLPLDVTPSGRRVAEEYLTVLYACAGAKPRDVAASTCTVGLAVLNALSASLRLRVFQDGTEWRQHYARGTAIEPLAPVDATSAHGTEFLFTLDAAILPRRAFVVDELAGWARTSLLQLELFITDEVGGREIHIPKRAG